MSSVQRVPVRALGDWLQLVDLAVQRLAGCSVYDLPDCAYADWYEDGLGPVAAARRAIRCVDGGD